MAWLSGKSDGSGGEAPSSASSIAAEYSGGAKIPGTGFTVVQVLGRGGHATVYEVENAIGKRLVAKVIHPHLANRGDFAQRIAEEARTLVQLEHPNIVAVYDLGITVEPSPRPFIVMERLNGKNGREILQEVGRLEIRHAIDIGIDVCSALSVAHAKKVVHQDIKPDNIFIHVGVDGRPVTKLVDFGIVRMIDRPQEKGVFEGTVLYAAPEQLRFQPVTAQTDLFAVGVLLFELMTGVRPFPDLDDAPSATVAVNMRLAHFAQPPPALSQSLLVPAELEALVEQCLSVSPDARPASAAKLGDSLRALRRKLQSVPNDRQLRTEATLLGAVAEVRGGAARAAPGSPTATFDPSAGRAGGRFGQSQDAPGRVAEGVLTAEIAKAGQSGFTERIPAPSAGPGRGRFADALEAERDPSSGDRPSDAPTSVPPEDLGPDAVALPPDAPSVGTLDPTVPRSELIAAPRRSRGTLGAIAALVLVAAIAGLAIRHRGAAPAASSRPASAPEARETGSVAATPPPPPPPVAATTDPVPPPAVASSDSGTDTSASATASAAPPPSNSTPQSNPAASGAPPPRPPPQAKSSGKPRPAPKESLKDWLEPESAPTAKPTPKPPAPKPVSTGALESF